MRITILSTVISTAALGIGAATITAAASTPRVNAAVVMHDRHESMETIGKQFKALHRELAADSPTVGTVRTSAAAVASLANRASGWFPAGTGPEAGKTGAKAEIWQPQNKADFAAKLTAFQKAAQGFARVARGSDVSAMKAAYADLGGTCKSCHDKYRMDMHH